jgi:ribosome-binding factor A
MGTIKQKRTAEQIKVILSELVIAELRDPRLQGITITDLTIDREFQHVDVYVNALADETRHEEVMAGLNHAKPFLRHELSGRIRLRKVPELHFHWDTTLQRVVELDEIFGTLEIPPAEEEPATQTDE